MADTTKKVGELEQFIRETIEQIRGGTKDELIRGTVDFEVVIVKKRGVGGKIGISVLDASGSKGSENTSKISFKVQLKGSVNDNGQTRV